MSSSRQPDCNSCVAEDARDCSGLIWGALVVQHDNPVMPEDYEPVPPFPPPCDCPCHSESGGWAMSADPLCLCGHPSSIHAYDDDERRPCYVGGCKCHDYWLATRPPQPPPKPGRAAVWPLVSADATAAGVSPRLLEAMQERDELGQRRYGRQLETHNGRNPLEDAKDESLDLVAYLRQWAEETPNADERARRWRLYKLALWWADTLCAERQRKDG